MARTGIYPSDVKKAKDALLARGKSATVAAVRAELGHTGSLTTISRHLKELESEALQTAEIRKTTTSQAVHHLIEQLTAEMEKDAQRLFSQRECALHERETVYNAQIAELTGRCEGLQAAETSLTSLLVTERAAHVETRNALNAESVKSARLDQQTVELHTRLEDHEKHRQSLEQKHEQARNALGHFRQAAKEQRDQEHQRHEQQVHQLQSELHQARQSLAAKGEEVTRLTGDGIRLLTEVSHLRKDVDRVNARAAHADTALLRAQREKEELVLRIAEAQGRSKEMAASQTAKDAQIESLGSRVQELEVTLATSQAQELSHHAVIADLRGMMAHQQDLLKRRIGPSTKQVRESDNDSGPPSAA